MLPIIHGKRQNLIVDVGEDTLLLQLMERKMVICGSKSEIGNNTAFYQRVKGTNAIISDSVEINPLKHLSINFRAGFKNKNVWVGISDIKQEGRWISLETSKANTFFYWNSGEPNGKRGENCGMLYSNTAKWNDISCNAKLPYVCRRTGKLVNI